MLDPKYLEPKPGMTSLEAAALYLSDGETSDPAKAAHYADGTMLDMDELQRAHLRRMMGFDFGVTLKKKKMTIYSKEYPYVSTTVKYSGVMDESSVDILVDACLATKIAFEEAKEADRKKDEALSDEQ